MKNIRPGEELDAYIAGYRDSPVNVWDVGSWPEHLQDAYVEGHYAASRDRLEARKAEKDKSK